MKGPQPEDLREDLPLVVLQPSSGWRAVDVGEVWAYRELFYFLMWRDIKVRYRQTFLGGVWAVIQPLVTTVVFTVVFSKVAGVNTFGLPYPLFAFTALLPWTLFSQSLLSSTESLVGGANLVSKVYFPRIIVPVASCASFLLDFAIGLAFLAILLVYYSVAPTVAIVFLPFFIVLALESALAVGIWLAALNVRYRDVRYVVPFVVSVLLLASPIGYSVQAIKGPVVIFYAINPMTGIAEGFRWCILGTPFPSLLFVIPSVVITLVLFLTGLFYFRRTERTFADHI